jgi:hypothetical protein
LVLGFSGDLIVTDPTFGEIAFCEGAWDGLVPFESVPAGTSEFAGHVWADESGPSDVQRATFEQIKGRCTGLWPTVAKVLLGLHPVLGFVAAAEDHLSSTVDCYIEAEASQGHVDFELVYGFNLEGENSRGFFVRIVGWQVAEAVIAE